MKTWPLWLFCCFAKIFLIITVCPSLVQISKNLHVKVLVGVRQSPHRYLSNFRWIRILLLLQSPYLPFDPNFSIDMTSSYVIYRFLPFRNFELRKIGQNDRIR